MTRAARGPFLALLVACLFFATRSDRFFSLENAALILQQVVVIGVIASYAVSSSVQSLVFSIEATDVPTRVVLGAALFLLAFIACTIPARRAARVDPMTTLRAD